MAEKVISRKRIRSDASEGEVSIDSQDSMLSGLDRLDVDKVTIQVQCVLPFNYLHECGRLEF